MLLFISKPIRETNTYYSAADRETWTLRPTPAERLPFRWVRYKEPYVTSHGQLLDAARDEPEDSYDPFEATVLPTALGKVTDERSVLRFCRHFGPLGHWAHAYGLQQSGVSMQFDHPEGGYEEGRLGDPLQWFLTQARSARFAMELIEALQYADDRSLAAVLARHRVKRTTSHPDGRPVAIDYYPVALGLEVDWSFGPQGDEGMAYNWWGDREQAVRIVLELVRANTVGVRWVLAEEQEGSGRLRTGLTAWALFNVVWWHIGNAAFAGTQVTDRREEARLVRLCELPSCRAPFIVTDRRQRFCPAEYEAVDEKGRSHPGKSRCAALYQKRYGKKGSA